MRLEVFCTLQSFSTIQQRREASRWTRIHPIFAIGQLGVFLVSLVLLGLYAAHLAPFTSVFVSVLLKVALMIGAVVTGSLWEHDVYGKWWFAHEFFVEDVMTANVFWLHALVIATAYVVPGNTTLVLAFLAFAYLIYALNVAQYIVQHVGMQKRAVAEREITRVAA